MLAANPDLKGVFQQSDYALSPTLNVLKQAGRDAKVGEDGHIYNISIDASPQALELIRERRPRRRRSRSRSTPTPSTASSTCRTRSPARSCALGKTDHGSEVVEFNGNKMDLLPAVLVTKENVDDPALWGNQIK